jgi:uncharacterized protein with beta-barrel porin domain
MFGLQESQGASGRPRDSLAAALVAGIAISTTATPALAGSVVIPGNGADFTNSGVITGDAGAGGGRIGTFGQPGDPGGVGVQFTGSGASFTNTATGTVTGGAGGPGGNGATFPVPGGNGPGGAGGVGVQFTANGATVNNAGTITGGAGGAGGGNGVFGGGTGGTGGVGVQFTAGGATFINSGTVSGGRGGSSATGIPGGGGAGITGSDLTLINSGTITGGFATGGGQANAISFSGGTNILELQAGSTITGNVVAFSTADTLRLGGASNASFDVSQIGSQYQNFGIFQKTRSSTWTLTGANTAALPWAINAGTLIVNGTMANATMTVNSGGTLAGSGTVGNILVTGGTFAPGSSTPGSSMTVTGALGLNAISTYAVSVNAALSSFATVSGVATLGGARVNAIFVSGSDIVKQYTILNAGGISGTFGALANTNLPANFTDTLSYDATHAYLNLVANFQGSNGNQSNVANALNTFFNTGGNIPGAFANLNGNGLSQASGQPGASTAQTGITAAGLFVKAIFDGALDDNGQGGAIGFAADDDAAKAYAAKRKVPGEAKDAYAAVTPLDHLAEPFASRWNVWASAYGGDSRVSGDAGAGTSTTTSRIVGVAAGASDRVTPNTQLGFALGGAGSNFDLDGGFGGGRADVFNAAVYAKHTMGAAYLAGLLGYSWQDTTTDRTVTAAGIDQLRASFKAQALSTRLEGGWRYAAPVVGMTPYAAVQTASFFLPSYGETAASGSNAFALNYASKTVTATRGELGAKFDKAMLVQGGVLTLKAKTAWAHDWNTDRSATATFQTLPGATFTTNGAQPSADAALLLLGAEMAWHNGWTLAANFDGEFSRTTAGYAGKCSVRYTW